MDVNLKISEETLAFLFTDAIQGPGSAYWANEYADLNEDRDEKGNTTFFSIGQPLPGAECNEPPVHTEIRLPEIKAAVAWLLQHAGEDGACHPTYIRCLLNDDYDAVTTDVVLQVAVFGKVIYG